MQAIHSKALLFHSKNSPALNKNTQKKKYNLEFTLVKRPVRNGTIKISSTSKITKITAKIKNRNETGWRVSSSEVNPHSRGDKNSRLNLFIFAKVKPIDKRIIPRALVTNNQSLSRCMFLMAD